MTLGARIQSRLAALDMSQSELARRLSLAQTTVNSLVRGDSRTSTHLHRIARELQTTPSYLSGEIDDPAVDAAVPPTPEQIAEHLDLVPIASIDLAYGMGGTYSDAPFEEEHLHFPRSWIRSITTTPPEFLTFVRGRGDSMRPTIADEDMVLIDRSMRRPFDQDAIWALSVGNIGMIKRLRIRGQGVTILSDNPQVPPEEALYSEINIVGRVVYICHSV